MLSLLFVSCIVKHQIYTHTNQYAVSGTKLTQTNLQQSKSIYILFCFSLSKSLLSVSYSHYNYYTILSFNLEWRISPYHLVQLDLRIDSAVSWMSR